MKIVFITGNHPRHAYIARAIASTGLLDTVIIEQREAFQPSAPDNIPHDLSVLFSHHFNERDRVESLFFDKVRWPNVNLLDITIDQLNSSKIRTLLTQIKPGLLLTYGCHMLNDETLNCVQGEKWNCHGGLSPWYRGATTHFWPSYMLEPQMTGMTVHDLTSALDAGDVVHQCASDLIRGDSLHMLAARSVIKLGEELPRLIHLLSEKGQIIKKRHTTQGALWPAAKWRPEHLRVIYQLYSDKIVDAYLDGELINKQPTLYRQF